jgi:hypothetical protein
MLQTILSNTPLKTLLVLHINATGSSRAKRLQTKLAPSNASETARRYNMLKEFRFDL